MLKNSFFRHTSVSSTYPGPSVRQSIPFCQRLWALTKHRDDIVVADMAADMEVHMVADMEVDKVADKMADMVVEKNWPTWSWTWWPIWR